jgi:hypothetical protein
VHVFSRQLQAVNHPRFGIQRLRKLPELWAPLSAALALADFLSGLICMPFVANAW